MNYHHMIEPYLYGNLSPEDEVAFERQLSRDPDLADATGRRLNAEEVLAGFSEYRTASRQQSSSRMLLFMGLAALLIGLFWWKMRSTDDSIESQNPPLETPVTQSGVSYD